MNINELNEIPDLQFIPVNKHKQPIIKDWQNSIKKHDLSKGEYVGLVCGKPSQHDGSFLEVIDVDTKYDLTGGMYEHYKKLVHSVNDVLLKKLVVQKTRSGGYHLIYRCKKIEGNIKLANRPTTDIEKDLTYKMTYEAEILKDGADEAKAKKQADRSRENDKVRVLFETRGLGGQIVVSPSDGYEFIYGDLFSISEITEEERETLFNTARQFNQVFSEVIVPKKTTVVKTKGISPFEDYNKRGDVVALLQNNGWKVVAQKGQKTIFLRPGQTTSQSSGNFDHSKNWFSVFTTSTEFDTEHAYLPYAVFAYLECNKDFTLASQRLFEQGYGEKDIKEKAPSTRVITSRINVEDEDFSFLASPPDYDPYLQQVRDGTLQMGLTTGFPSLDEYFLFKEGELLMTNGIDNTGKSVFTWYLAMLSAMLHGWQWVVFSSENTLGAFMRKCIQFYWGKQLHGQFQMSENEYNTAKEFVEKHFKLIKAQEDLYNYKDIINMVKKTRTKYPDIKSGMIDPYNSLKIDLSGFSKLSTHEYHYEALSELKSYGQKTNFSWVINNHAVTSALRLKDGDRKYPVAPRKEDTEGGGKFPNKSDSFITIHRVTQHPTDWMITEVHVRKVKDTETGGRPTPQEVPVKFEMYKGGTAFIERLYEGGRAVDPIHDWHIKNTPTQSSAKFPIPTDVQHIPKAAVGWNQVKGEDNEDVTF